MISLSTVRIVKQKVLDKKIVIRLNCLFHSFESHSHYSRGQFAFKLKPWANHTTLRLHYANGNSATEVIRAYGKKPSLDECQIRRPVKQFEDILHCRAEIRQRFYM